MVDGFEGEELRKGGRKGGDEIEGINRSWPLEKRGYSGEKA
jgi:hypothetical protein